MPEDKPSNSRNLQEWLTENFDAEFLAEAETAYIKVKQSLKDNTEVKNEERD